MDNIGRLMVLLKEHAIRSILIHYYRCVQLLRILHLQAMLLLLVLLWHRSLFFSLQENYNPFVRIDGGSSKDEDMLSHVDGFSGRNQVRIKYRLISLLPIKR